MNSAEVSVLRRWNDSKYVYHESKSSLGWCVDVRVRIAEGKHHQIRRYDDVCIHSTDCNRYADAAA